MNVDERNLCYSIIVNRYRHLFQWQRLRDVVSEVYAEALCESLAVKKPLTRAMADRAAYRLSRAMGFWRKGGTTNWHRMEVNAEMCGVERRGYLDHRKPMADAAQVERWLTRASA